MTKPQKYLVGGFLFGALGLYVLAVLSLASQVFETIFAPLFVFGRTVAALFVGSEGTTVEVVVLSIFNGLFYAIIFYFIGKLISYKKKE